MIKTDKGIAAAYAQSILKAVEERPDKTTTDIVKETVDFLLSNYETDPKNGFSTGDEVLGNLISLQASIDRTVSMNEVLTLEDKYFVSILNRIIK